MENFDLLSIGDAGMDAFMTPVEGETVCKLDTKECLISFSYGDKIPVKNLEFSIGGNAANNSIGARRLGISTAVVLTLGDDSVGETIIKKLKDEGVDATYVVQQPSTSSNYSTIINYSGERTIFVHHAPRSYEFPVNLPNTPWVYLTSMGESFRPFYIHMADWIKKNPQTKLVFNPGSWQMRSSYKDIQDIMGLTYLIFVNREEAEKLTKFEGNSRGKERDLLIELNKLGPKNCIITDGENGAFAYDSVNGIFLKVNAFPIEAYERTGAGDAFGAAALSALIHGKTLGEALIWGTCNSASVIGFTGSQKGLLRFDDLEMWLTRAKTSGINVVQF